MSEEPAFVRLWLEREKLWITSYTFKGSTLTMSTTSDEAAAKVFLSPDPVEIETLSRRAFQVTIIPATYAEWIEQDPTRKPTP